MKNKHLNNHEGDLEMEDDGDSQKVNHSGDGIERKQDYIIKVAAEETGIHPDTVKTSFDACWAAIQHELEQGNRVKLHGKGTFYLSRRRSRIGRNPATGEEHEVPEREAMAFQTSTAYGKYLRKVREKK